MNSRVAMTNTGKAILNNAVNFCDYTERIGDKHSMIWYAPANIQGLAQYSNNSDERLVMH